MRDFMTDDRVIKPVLDALYYSRITNVAARFSRAHGAIFTLHHVSAYPVTHFKQNRAIQITPEFLEECILLVKDLGYDIVSLDEAVRRVTSEKDGPKFVCFTADDGYRNNLDEAIPVFQRHRVPFTVYVVSSFCDRTGIIWWQALEQVVLNSEKILFKGGGYDLNLTATDPASRQKAFDALYSVFRRAPPVEQTAWVREICAAHGVDLGRLCERLVMSWSEIARFAQLADVTIGAHSVHHYPFNRLSPDEVLSEMRDNLDHIEAHIGYWPRHFAFPYGDSVTIGPREFALAEKVGFASAVTTRKGMLYGQHSAHMTALPRISLNGAYQKGRYIETLLSGMPFRLWNKGRRLNVR